MTSIGTPADNAAETSPEVARLGLDAVEKSRGPWKDAWRRLIRNKAAIVGLLVIALMGFLGASVVLATVTGQLADYRVTSHDLGVVSDFVSASTVVHTPAGDLAGPAGVEAFVGSLQRAAERFDELYGLLPM